MSTSNASNEHILKLLCACPIIVISLWLAVPILKTARETRLRKEAEFSQVVQERSRLRREAAEAWEKKCTDTLKGEVYWPLPGRSKRFCLPKGTILAVED